MIHLIPSPIVANDISQLSDSTIASIHAMDSFIVERAKTARRFIKATAHPIPIQQLTIFEMDKHDPLLGLFEFLEDHARQKDIGVLSEAGCPGVADPGSEVVAWAHRNQIKVKPHIGPSSILMALMASGMNGQGFAFHGYLPNKKPQLAKRLKFLEKQMEKDGHSQLFIEAPYRNKFIIENCIHTLKPKTILAMSIDIGDTTEEHICLSVDQWRRMKLDAFHKRPAVFVIGKQG